jgi:hypothetical protein
MKYLLFVLLLTGCSGKSNSETELLYREFTLINGDVVMCKQSNPINCGVDLWECSNGQEYFCQINVMSKSAEEFNKRH